MTASHLKLWLIASSTLIIILSQSTWLVTIILFNVSLSESREDATEMAILSSAILVIGISGCGALAKHKYVNFLFLVFFLGNSGLAVTSAYFAISTFSEGNTIWLNILGGIFAFCGILFLQNLVVVYLICTHPQRSEILFDFSKVKFQKGLIITMPESSEENITNEKNKINREIKKTKRNVNEKPTIYTELPDQSMRFMDEKLDVSQI